MTDDGELVEVSRHYVWTHANESAVSRTVWGASIAEMVKEIVAAGADPDKATITIKVMGER